MIASLSYRRCRVSLSSRNLRPCLHNNHAGRSIWHWKDIGGLQNMAEPADYSKWSSEQLIDRVTVLEQQLKEQTIRSEPGISYFILLKLSLTGRAGINLHFAAHPTHHRLPGRPKRLAGNAYSILPSTRRASLPLSLLTWGSGTMALNITPEISPRCQRSRKNFGKP